MPFVLFINQLLIWDTLYIYEIPPQNTLVSYHNNCNWLTSLLYRAKLLEPEINFNNFLQLLTLWSVKRSSYQKAVKRLYKSAKSQTNLTKMAGRTVSCYCSAAGPSIRPSVVITPRPRFTILTLKFYLLPSPLCSFVERFCCFDLRPPSSLFMWCQIRKWRHGL